MAEQAFKFPDEQKLVIAEGEPDLKIEIVDDTPPADRNRAPLPKEIVEELDKDDLEEYSEKVQTRIKQMKKVWHDERRAKESAAREKDEALRFAALQHQENQQLKQRLGVGERVFVQEVTKAATAELTTAKEKLKKAYEAGDADAVVAAQEAITDAKIKLKEYESFRPSPLQKEEQGVQNNQQAQAPAAVQPPPLDPKIDAWRAKNEWFGTDEEMTALALGLHEKLVRSGVDPRSDDYYERVDKTMRKRFPEYEFGDETPQPKAGDPPPRKTTPNVVAPVSRSTGPRQVRLTPTQVALARKLGLTNEAYAREMIKLENQNG